MPIVSVMIMSCQVSDQTTQQPLVSEASNEKTKPTTSRPKGANKMKQEVSSPKDIQNQIRLLRSGLQAHPERICLRRKIFELHRKLGATTDCASDNLPPVDNRHYAIW